MMTLIKYKNKFNSNAYIASSKRKFNCVHNTIHKQ